MTEDQWKALLLALSEGDCLVMLGAGTSTYDDGTGRQVPLTDGLARHLAGLLREKGHPFDEAEATSLLYTATVFEQHCGQVQLRTVVSEFYKENQQRPAELLRLVAELPVPLIVNTALDAGVARAFSMAYRKCTKAHYTFKKERRPIDLPAPDRAAPMVYNLFGTTDDTATLVITEGDRLAFVDDTIRNNGAIPNSVLAELRGVKVVLLFGFDFEHWQMRILPKVLFSGGTTTAKLPGEAIVPLGGQPLGQGAMFFFKNQYGLGFLPDEPLGFVRELAHRWQLFSQKKEGKADDSGPVDAFIMYDPADEAFKTDLEKHLAMLQRRGRISTWDEGRLAAGDTIDEAVRERLEGANLILLLVSSDFLANDRLYETQLRLALERAADGRALVCPIIVRPCAWEAGPFGAMHTVLPPGRAAISTWGDRDLAFGKVAEQLDGYIDSLLENLKSTN